MCMYETIKLHMFRLAAGRRAELEITSIHAPDATLVAHGSLQPELTHRTFGEGL